MKNGSKYSILGEKVPKPGPKRTNFRVGGEVWADKMAFGTDEGSIGIIGGPDKEYVPSFRSSQSENSFKFPLASLKVGEVEELPADPEDVGADSDETGTAALVYLEERCSRS